LKIGETGPVFTGGGVLVLGWVLGAGFGALDAPDGGLRSALVVFPSEDCAGAAAPVSVPEPNRRPSSSPGAEEEPRVRMNADTATIAATATIDAPIALCERCAFRVRRCGGSLRRSELLCCLRVARAGGFR
jgi:hypothetical protein